MTLVRIAVAALSSPASQVYMRGASRKGLAVEAILPILIFVVAIVAVNVFEFGRPD